MSKEFEELVLKKLDNTENVLNNVVLKRLDNTDRLIQDVVLERLDNMERTFSSEIKNLNNKFTVFDYEINKKIDTLLDAFVVNTENDSKHEEKIESLDKKVLNHDIRISDLENKVLTA